MRRAAAALLALALAACGAAEPAQPPPSAGNALPGLCGDKRLVGAALAPIRGEGGCGIESPVRLSAAAGVRLTRPVTIECRTATVLADWLERVARPAARELAGADIAAITPFAGYACRPRNSRPGARLSEHATGRAIDIGAVELTDGRALSVRDDWRRREGALLRAMWRGACGPFGTVLGPEADRWHLDHLHLDIARYRNGPYCR